MACGLQPANRELVAEVKVNFDHPEGRDRATSIEAVVSFGLFSRQIKIWVIHQSLAARSSEILLHCGTNLHAMICRVQKAEKYIPYVQQP